MRTLALAFVAAVLAAQPKVENAEIHTRSAAAGLRAAVDAVVAEAAGRAAWFGWVVPAVGQSTGCCCKDSTVYLEGAREMAVLFKVEYGRITHSRTSPIDCSMDAGGLPFHILTDVKPRESIDWLVERSSIGTIAQHADPYADEVLDRYLAAGQREDVRRRATGWLWARGRRGFEKAAQMLRSESNDSVREQAAASVYRSKQPESERYLIAAAREDTSPRVRGRALLWLGERGGEQAQQVISEAIEKDAAPEVRKRGVAALSRLPEPQAVPALITLARSNRNPAVRKEAVQWLGRSKDPRALAYIEQILAK